MNILFDETQKERGKIFDNFKILSQDLESADHKIAIYDSYPIKYSSIKNADIMAFLCPDGSKLYGYEVQALLRFVDEGGSLVIFANAGGDKGLNTNLNTLLKHFDIEIISNQVFDYQEFDVELETCPIVERIFKHPITKYVKELTLVSSCSLNIGADVIELVRTKQSSDPPSSTVMALSQKGKGKVFVSGSYLMFSDRKAGINLRDNKLLITNLFKWLELIKGKKIKLDQIKTIEVQKTQEIQEAETQEIQEAETQEMQEAETQEMQEAEVVSEEIPQPMMEEKQIEDERVEKPTQEVSIEESIAIILELQEQVEALDIEDQGYRDILLTDMARRRGVDYGKILPFLDNIEAGKEIEEIVVSEEKAVSKDDKPISIPIPESVQKLIDRTIEYKVPRDTIREIKEVASGIMDPTETMETLMGTIDLSEMVGAVNSLKKSVDILSANIVNLLGEIVLALQDLKRKK